MTLATKYDAHWIRCAYAEVAVWLNRQVAANTSRGVPVSVEPRVVSLAFELTAATLYLLIRPHVPDDRESRNLHEFLTRSELAILTAFALVRLFAPPARDDCDVQSSVAEVLARLSVPPVARTDDGEPIADNEETRRRNLLDRLGSASHKDIASYVGLAGVYNRRTEYNRACYYSARFETERDKELLTTALGCITAAAEGQSATFKKSAENDPMLRALRRKRSSEWSRLFK